MVPHSHRVQVSDGSSGLFLTNIREFLAGGPDGSSIVIATEEHNQALKPDFPQARFVEASRALGRCVQRDQPDWERFDRFAGDLIRSLEPPVRVYGEMVGVLWQEGRFSASIRLEEFWNRLLGQVEFDLFCGYSIDVFDREFQESSVDSLLRDHTGFVPATAPHLAGALRAAINEALGERAIEPVRLPAGRRAWSPLPEAEATILWLRANFPDEAEAIVKRARTLYTMPDAARPAAGHAGNGRAPVLGHGESRTTR